MRPTIALRVMLSFHFIQQGGLMPTGALNFQKPQAGPGGPETVQTAGLP